ncbi:MAG: glycosyltransferase [Gammaproteobacteria bacterium]|nr:glycosyltransferase [Gammaproteobacteria bacterium]
MSSKIELSVIIPVSESRYDDATELYLEYKKALESSRLNYEFIYVLDGPYPEVLSQLQAQIDKGEERLSIVKLAKYFGEATALRAGFENSAGELIMTLPAYEQVCAEELPKLLKACRERDVDMMVSRRWPRRDSAFNRLQSRVFNQIMEKLTGAVFNDLGCSVRVFKRRVIDEIHLYGDQHRFFPALAYRHGFKVQEMDSQQSQKDVFQRVYPPGIYVRRLLDLLSVFFLMKFTKKPLRFFGLVGVSIATFGGLVLLYVVGDRLFGGVPLGDRPALMLSSLFIVLGAQLVSIGLIGEIVIFTHAKDIKEYTVEEIIN